MSASTLHFISRTEFQASVNIEAFVSLCKQSSVLDSSKQFDSNIWDLGYFKGQNKIQRAIFSSMEASQISQSQPFLAQPFLDFAKALLVYLHDKRPVVCQAVRVSALRFLEAALRGCGKDSCPTAVNEDVLDTAVELARKQLSARVAYRVAGQLELISELMNSKRFIVLRQRWHHGMNKPRELGSRISKESIEAREKKLPSAAVLRALANIFHQATKPMHILVSSYTALMLCAPERINEVLRLSRNCIVRGDGRFSGRVGIRWAGSKGASDTIKWIPSAMVSVAEKAVSNLLRVSLPAQQIAEWYTNNPKEIYIHQTIGYLRNYEYLTVSEVADILWGDDTKRHSAYSWVIANGIPSVSLGAKGKGYSFKHVEEAVLKLLPPTFPYVLGAPELLCKDSLALVRLNESHCARATYVCMFHCVDNSIVTNPLGRPGHRSIFEDFSFTEDDGSAIWVRSHSFRHYLNMLAQMGGLSSAEIAIFSGRKDVGQNRAYDHMSSEEIQAPVGRAIKEGLSGDLVPITSRNLVARSEFAASGVAAAHTTEFGWCQHNFASEPCQMYRDCINCEEQVCIKGEARKEANLRSLKVETEHLLSQARQALTNEEYGADTWVVHQMKTLERVNVLLSILDDPSVSDGARIRLNIENAPLVTVADSETITKAVTFERRKRLK